LKDRFEIIGFKYEHMLVKKIELTISSSYSSVALVAQTIVAMVKAENITQACLGDIELCIDEIGNNVVEHAYENRNDLKITFKLLLFREKIVLIISDNGITMLQGALFSEEDWNMLDKNNIATWKESGRGLQLVRGIMDDMFYWTEFKRNYFKMVKNLP